MTQASIVIPDSDGLTFLNNANSAYAAIATRQKGGTAPSSPDEGWEWIDDSGTPYIVNTYINSTWVPTGYIYPTEGVFRSLNRGRVFAKTASYTVLLSDIGATFNHNATSGSATYTIPLAATTKNGFDVSVIKTDASANTVTLQASGSDTINGSSSIVLSGQYDCVTIVSDGSSAYSAFYGTLGASGALLASNNLSDLDDASTARTNLGLGTSAVENVGLSSGDVPQLDSNGKVPSGVLALEINQQTGTTYTTVIDDAGKLIKLNNASSIALTIPPNSSVAYPVGTVIAFQQDGAGTVTMGPGSGVTLENRNGLVSSGQYAMWSIVKTSTDTWAVAGDLTS
tara:strand:+ start:46941 stop:47963 length:1023 start_codon:yes stop_codon:yes gene_type:complete